LKNTFINYKTFSIVDSNAIKLFGQNQKKMLIIINSDEFDNEQSLNFLRKILAAIKYDLDVDAIIAATSTDNHFQLSALYQNTSPNTVISFGFPPKQLGIYANLRNYAFFSLQEVHYLFCDSLNHIEQQKDLKAALWDALRGRFLQ
jgi:hypothetical protein